MRILLFISIMLCFCIAGFTTEIVHDANTLLLLKGNNSPNGAEGEIPDGQNVSYTSGVANEAFRFGLASNYLHYSNSFLDATSGTVETWVKPFWDGNDNQSHTLLEFGGGGGILILKDGGNYLRAIFNRYGINGNPEIGVTTNVSNWTANTWYHIAVTWNASSLELYINGILMHTTPVTFGLPSISASIVGIGNTTSPSSAFWDGLVDEFRISNVARSASEINNTYAAGLDNFPIELQEPPGDFYPGWMKTMVLNRITDFGDFPINNVQASWSTSNTSIASIDAQGKITAHASGTVEVTAMVGNQTSSVNITISAPVLPPEQISNPDPFLTTPMNNASANMPVVVILYLPTTDGVNLDASETNALTSISSMKSKILAETIKVKFSLEEGSKFRGYNHPSADPFLGYQIIDYIIIYEPLPRGKVAGTGIFFPDYNQILSRVNAQNYVENLGVKEFWLWGYHHGEIVPAESNMSSPVTGDISNSYRFNDDMPVFNSTYVLYNYNFTRGANEAVHNHGHQLEAQLLYVNNLQDGNETLFREKFVGWAPGGGPPIGRVGDTHHPANTTTDYGYNDLNLASSDIADWKPTGGTTALVNANTWGDIPYAWPYGQNPSVAAKREAHWYIYWMQSMPGENNNIPYGGATMTNWWEFTADWDAAILSGMGLYEGSFLPVDWLEFTANRNKQGVLLNWTTANESNSDYFEVQRSIDGRSFEILATLNSIGNSSTLTKYSYLDQRALNLKSYYRIHQIDQDGQASYSSIVVVNPVYMGENMTIIPNPWNSSFQIKLPTTWTNNDIDLTIKSMDGKIVYQQSISDYDSSLLIKIATPLLPNGVYIITASNGRDIIVEKGIHAN